MSSAETLTILPATQTKDLATGRTDDQAILYRFTDRLYRAESIDEIYQASLDAIIGGLRCHRASILLFDEAGVMRFVAWRGLSENYREAVEGHTPWKPGAKDPEPITIDDIASSDQPADLKSVVAGEGISALSFIPLVSHGAVIGKFMAYHDAAHAFTREELDLAVIIARQLGFAIETRRIEDKLRESEARFREAADSAPAPVWMTDPDGKVELVNRAFQEFAGLSADALMGDVWVSFVHPDDIGRVAETRRAAWAADHAPYKFEARFRRADGEWRWMEVSSKPRKDSSGAFHGYVGLSVDRTEARRAEEQRTLLIHELNHRVKNTLATVQSLAMQTLRKTERSHDAREAFEARLTALSRTHDVLTRESWQGADLREIVDQALEPFRTGGERLAIDGPDAHLSPQQTLALSMALNELATNAAKYGSLSNDGGQVKLSWRIVKGNGKRELQLTWSEDGGPPVSKPTRKGFGTRLIERSLGHDLGSAAKIEYRENGVVAVLKTPLEDA